LETPCIYTKQSKRIPQTGHVSYSMIYHARQVNGILIVAYIQLSSTLVL